MKLHIFTDKVIRLIHNCTRRDLKSIEPETRLAILEDCDVPALGCHATPVIFSLCPLRVCFNSKDSVFQIFKLLFQDPEASKELSGESLQQLSGRSHPI